MNLALPGIPGLFLYLMGTALILARIRTNSVRLRSWALVCIGLAVVLHAIVVGVSGWRDGNLDLGFYNTLSLVALVVVILMFLGALFRPVDSLGLILLPVAGVTIALQLTFGSEHTLMRDFGWQLKVHIALSVFAFSILSLAATQAVLLSFQDRALRKNPLSPVMSSLPSLQRMETVLFQLIGLGFGLLTMALITGGFYVSDLMAQHLIHKTVLSIAAWAVFGLLLWGRWKFGWRGRTAIRMTLAGIAVLLLAYFGSKLVLELILERVE